MDTRGVRENALSKNIEKYVEPIALGMAARREVKEVLEKVGLLIY